MVNIMRSKATIAVTQGDCDCRSQGWRRFNSGCVGGSTRSDLPSSAGIAVPSPGDGKLGNDVGSPAVEYGTGKGLDTGGVNVTSIIPKTMPTVTSPAAIPIAPARMNFPHIPPENSDL